MLYSLKMKRNEETYMLHRKEGQLDFERITLSIIGTMASTREYELLKTKDGLLATMYDGFWNYNDTVKRKDCQVGQGIGTGRTYREVAQTIHRLGVEKWDGFCKSDPNALDGESFSLEIVLADKKKITAHGCNAYPKNYREFLDCLDEAVYGPKEY